MLEALTNLLFIISQLYYAVRFQKSYINKNIHFLSNCINYQFSTFADCEQSALVCVFVCLSVCSVYSKTKLILVIGPPVWIPASNRAACQLRRRRSDRTKSGNTNKWKRVNGLLFEKDEKWQRETKTVRRRIRGRRKRSNKNTISKDRKNQELDRIMLKNCFEPSFHYTLSHQRKVFVLKNWTVHWAIHSVCEWP